MRQKSTWLPAALLAAGAAGCASGPEAVPAPTATAPVSKPSATDLLFSGRLPAKLLPGNEVARKIETAVDSHFRSGSRRGYLMTDKPLYQPGETLWYRAELRQTDSLTLASGIAGMTVELVSPRGAVVATQRVAGAGGIFANAIDIPSEVDGGEYVLRTRADDGTADEKRVIVNRYEAPRLQKQLEFVRKAYGPGDPVAAGIQIKRATGEPFAGKALTGIISVDDVEVARIPLTTDADGKAAVRFTLPTTIARGDGLLTVLAPDGGVTESIQRRIPILLKSLDIALYPEGGDLVEGLPGRVYLAAQNSLGKPADIEGRVVDDRGAEVATFASLHDGMARFELTPSVGRSYRVEVTKPAGIAQTFVVPAAKPKGCVLRALDEQTLDFGVACSSAQTLVVEAALREKRIVGASFAVEAMTPTRVALSSPTQNQGVVRVTLFDEKQAPVAERLVYRGRGRDLRVAITADKKRYAPRDPVTLTVTTTDVDGKPVAANLGLAVVDDTVLTFADDKGGRILSRLYLEPELGGKIEEPGFYFGDKPEAPAALDLLLGTRGWRRFDWQLVFNPPPPPPPVDMAPMANWAAAEGARPNPVKNEQRPRGRVVVAKPVAVQPAGPPPKPVAGPAAVRVANDGRAHAAGAVDDKRAVGGLVRDGEFARRLAREDMEGDDRIEGQAAWAPVRVFPAGTDRRGSDDPRTDFRETLHWAPVVETGIDGTAQVRFYLSDAVTSFRAIAEGASVGGLPGRGEAVVQSKLPMSLDAHLPIEVSAGDTISLPVTLSNESERTLHATLDARFGAAFRLGARPATADIALDAGEKRTFFFPLEVTGTEGESEVQLALAADGLRDEIKKKVRIVPLGFPFEVARAGTLKTDAQHALSLAGALPGTIRASVTMYPSPLASMTQGLQGLIREPGGCFEQTSSSNYPNVMILSYLGANDAADPELVERTQGVLDKGYKLLTGYETKAKGYEWFGQTPGHEALTAYGLMEFADMGRVYEVDVAMVERTADWLLSRRDGKGGFQRSSQALDSFGRAGAATTDGYIVWALSEAKRLKGLDAELAAQEKRGLESSDPYLVGLAANTLLNVAPTGTNTQAIVKRLAAMQGKDGSFTGAKESITMSGGDALTIETTALAAMAFIKASPAGEREAELRATVDWLNGHRGGYGEWGSTQSTILALKAMTAYADHSRQTAADGTVTLVVNGREVGQVHFEKGRRAAIVFDDFDSALRPGDNSIELKLDSQTTLPYAVSVSYRAERPQSSERVKVAVSSELAKSSVKLGEGVKLRAHVENRTDAGVPMTLARVGIPGGMVFQTWQLKELVDKGLVDFYETRPREVILYWRALAPNAKKDVDLELLAAVPGRYTAPATSAYLYYTNEDRAWNAPQAITVER